jgi:hypothetical protein
MGILGLLTLQQDGALPHFGRQEIAFLHHHFQNHWIGMQSLIAWPLGSPDCTPFDYYLWGHMKSLVYTVKSTTSAELLNCIMDASMLIRNDKPSLMRSLLHFHEGPQCARIIKEVISSNYLISISIVII